MHFLQWWSHEEQNHLIVADTEASAIRVFDAVVSHYKRDEIVPKAMWVGERIELPGAFKAQIEANKYEEDFRQHVQNVAMWALTWEIHHKVYERKAQPEPLPNFIKCPDGGCEDCSYGSFHINPAYDLRGAWEDQNPHPFGWLGDGDFEPFWIVLKDFGHHCKGIDVQEVKTLADLDQLSDLRYINLCFRGEQAEVPEVCVEKIRKQKVDAVDDRNDWEKERRQMEEERALEAMLEAEQFFADLEARGFKR